MKNTVKEFKDFISKGNVIDLAVGVIIGGAFGKIVSSMVDDIIMPLVGALVGGVDLTYLYVSLDGNRYSELAEAKEAGAPILAYGVFLQNVIDFLIIAFVIFMAIKQMGKAKARFSKKEEEEEALTKKTCPFCQSEIHIVATRCPYCTSQLEGAGQ